LKVLVTGANGFIGRNLVVALTRAQIEVATTDVDSPEESIHSGANGATVVFHLAGVNRPEREAEFETGNVGSLTAVFEALDHIAATAPGSPRPTIVLSSSTQAANQDPYGRSKLAAEKALEAYVSRTASGAVIYRLTGVFGKWCRPNYNSVVATYCHSVARDKPITISDPARTLELVYIDDVVEAFMSHLNETPLGVTRGAVRPSYRVSLGELAQRIRSFRDARETLLVSDATDPFGRRLLATYVSYLPPESLSYSLVQRRDARGTLAELLKSTTFGQMFVSRTNPGVTRGNHYHDTKVEKFCVLEGDAVIRFRPVLGSEVIEYRVKGTDLAVVDIPPGMTHSIENVGSTEMIVLFWASEILDQRHPDTYSSEVLRG
jgi:UDP-2-acetamido-2,6-beta-L-arabino-hexul-4-ose reductase